MAEEHAEQQETVAVNDCECVSDKAREQYGKWESADLLADFDSESMDLDDEQDEFKDVVMSMSI